VGATAQYIAADTLDISGEGGVTIDADQQLVLTGGKASSITMTKGSAVLDTPKISLESDTKIVLKGKTLDLTKGG
jgi:hypothetical protein